MKYIIKAFRSATIAILLAATVASAQDAQKPAPPAGPASPALATPSLGDLSLEIAKLQRDLLLKDSQRKDLVTQYEKLSKELEPLQAALAGKVGEAGKLCKTGETFDSLKLACQVPEKLPPPAGK